MFDDDTTEPERHRNDPAERDAGERDAGERW
jgi:hypothetical protein